MKRKAWIFIIGTLVGLPGCSQGYVVPEGAPTAQLLVDYDGIGESSAVAFRLYTFKDTRNCAGREVIPAFTHRAASEDTRTATIEAGKRMIFKARHQSPTGNMQHNCALYFSMTPTADARYRVTFEHPRFSVCGVLVEQWEPAREAWSTDNALVEQLEATEEGSAIGECVVN